MAGGARIAALHVDYETVQGAGNARGFATGVRFKLTKYPRQDQNWEYLILAADYQFQSDAFGSSGAPNTGPVFQCWFTALSSPTQHPPPRPASRVPKPPSSSANPAKNSGPTNTARSRSNSTGTTTQIQ